MFELCFKSCGEPNNITYVIDVCNRLAKLKEFLISELKWVNANFGATSLSKAGMKFILSWTRYEQEKAFDGGMDKEVHSATMYSQ